MTCSGEERLALHVALMGVLGAESDQPHPCGLACACLSVMLKCLLV